MQEFDAVILAGGAGRRLGGADKPGLDVGGRTLLQRVADAAHDARTLIVVGPQRAAPAAHYVREHPPGAGPLAALRVGLAQVASPWFALLAADMPFFDESALTALRAAAASSGAGAVLVDAEERLQWTAGVWRAEALRVALADYSGRSLYGVLAPLAPEPVRLPEAAADCDTPQALAHARARLGTGPARDAR
ncbi:molybdenum cofactor guanylyltransferase [Nocardiopsis ansamitocini]|uniref:MobA-like NTP transferase domain-containing protein n=1 Tax=Nocardiopsis ansamitocini TaxID=1670832 RepID=A0A9W6P2I0_9ACTN|nr:NTP transferase domain-containing protein [Nocardiopsis ansamitocini]GLU45833.1 hypothetical protein Nans01_01840 [Nocardiopsis ansamitocini]